MSGFRSFGESSEDDWGGDYYVIIKSGESKGEVT